MRALSGLMLGAIGLMLLSPEAADARGFGGGGGHGGFHGGGGFRGPVGHGFVRHGAAGRPGFLYSGRRGPGFGGYGAYGGGWGGLGFGPGAIGYGLRGPGFGAYGYGYGNGFGGGRYGASYPGYGLGYAYGYAPGASYRGRVLDTQPTVGMAPSPVAAPAIYVIDRGGRGAGRAAVRVTRRGGGPIATD